MIFLSIFICFYLFFFRRQRRNFLYRTHVKTSSCGTIERIERKSRLARRVGECPAGEIVQIFSKSFKFISRQNDSNPINPPNQLNHREAVCLYKTSSCGTIERMERMLTEFFNHGLSWFYGFSLMDKPLLGFILITRIRASHGSCNHPDGLSPRKRKSAESVIIGVNKSD